MSEELRKMARNAMHKRILAGGEGRGVVGWKSMERRVEHDSS